MSNKNDGGPAFPWCGDLNECPTINLGMTIRDYFAAKAMQAWINSAPTLDGENKDHAASIAAVAYMQADAMLVERAK